MTRLLVAAQYVWDEYPGLRAGRLYSGQGELGRHPRGLTHAVVSAEAGETVCGRPRADFPYDFAESVRLDDAELCSTCGLNSTG